jgi:agmatinase
MNQSGIIKSLLSEEADVVLLKVPYEGTVSRGKGAIRGPTAVCRMLGEQVETFDYLLGRDISEKVRIVEKSVKIGKNEQVEDLVKKMEKETGKYFAQRKIPVVLGGEHSVSVGAILAAKKFFQNLTVVQIDAHADLRDDNSDYEDNPKRITKYAHSCAMRRVHEAGCQLVQVGVRAIFSEEAEFIKKEKIEKNIFYTPVKASFSKIISRCPTKKIYLTIDVDGFDPSVMPGTGTPEPGGLSWDWTLGFFRELFSKKEVVGFDIVEVSPKADCQRTEYAAAKLLYHLIGLKFSKNNGR